MKKRQGKGFLRFMFFFAAFWLVGVVLIFLTGGNLTAYDEYGEKYSILEYFYGYVFVIVAILLVAIIPNFYFFSFTCLFLNILMEIVFMNKVKIFTIAIIWGIEMLATIIFSIVSYMGTIKPHRPSIWDRIKHVPDGYKNMSNSARKSWIDFFNSISHKE